MQEVSRKALPGDFLNSFSALIWREVVCTVCCLCRFYNTVGYFSLFVLLECLWRRRAVCVTESAVSVEQAQSRNSEVAPVVTAGAPLSVCLCLTELPAAALLPLPPLVGGEPAAAAGRQDRRADGGSLPAGAPTSLGCEAVITLGSDNCNRGGRMRTRSRARAHQEPGVRSRT